MTTRLPHPSVPPIADERSAANGAPAAGAALMTAANLDQLREELEQLRARSRREIARELREARAYGSDSNNDELHAVREEQMVLEAHIASLEETIARARLVDPGDAGRGTAIIGSIVLIEDLDSGAASQYRLANAHGCPPPDTISAASPMGRALVGATPGAVVTFDLPNGRSRSVWVADVTTEGAPDPRSRAAA